MKTRAILIGAEGPFTGPRVNLTDGAAWIIRTRGLVSPVEGLNIHITHKDDTKVSSVLMPDMVVSDVKEVTV